MKFKLTSKREESPQEYQARVKAERVEATRRRDEVRELANEAEPARRRKLMEAQAKAEMAWEFSAKLSAGFLVMRWTDDRGAHAHALNLSSVTDIQIEGFGSPVGDDGIVWYNRHTWDVRSNREFFEPYYSFWDENLTESYSSAAKPGSIKFVGTDFVLGNIPHLFVSDAHNAIVGAIEASSDTASKAKEGTGE